jgi:hypothetical protein
VRGCSYRTNRLAWRVLTLHARHRLEVDAGIRRIAFIVRINADPLHLTAALHLLLADHGDIVLRLAGHRTSLAANTGIQVNRHAPGILLVEVFLGLEIGVQRFLLAVWTVLRLFFRILMGEVLVLNKLFQRRHFDRFAVVHAEVALCDGDIPEAIGNVDLDAAGNVL